MYEVTICLQIYTTHIRTTSVGMNYFNGNEILDNGYVSGFENVWLQL